MAMTSLQGEPLVNIKLVSTQLGKMSRAATVLDRVVAIILSDSTRAEFLPAVLCVVWGVIMVDAASTFADPKFVGMAERGPEWAWGLMFLAVGLWRVYAVYKLRLHQRFLSSSFMGVVWLYSGFTVLLYEHEGSLLGWTIAVLAVNSLWNSLVLYYRLKVELHCGNH